MWEWTWGCVCACPGPLLCLYAHVYSDSWGEQASAHMGPETAAPACARLWPTRHMSSPTACSGRGNPSVRWGGTTSPPSGGAGATWPNCCLMGHGNLHLHLSTELTPLPNTHGHTWATHVRGHTTHVAQHTQTHACTHTCLPKHVSHPCAHMHMHALVHIHMCTHTCTRGLNTCKHTRAFTHVHTHARVRTQHIHACPSQHGQERRERQQKG